MSSGQAAAGTSITSAANPTCASLEKDENYHSDEDQEAHDESRELLPSNGSAIVTVEISILFKGFDALVLCPRPDYILTPVPYKPDDPDDDPESEDAQKQDDPAHGLLLCQCPFMGENIQLLIYFLPQIIYFKH